MSTYVTEEELCRPHRSEITVFSGHIPFFSDLFGLDSRKVFVFFLYQPSSLAVFQPSLDLLKKHLKIEIFVKVLRNKLGDGFLTNEISMKSALETGTFFL